MITDFLISIVYNVVALAVNLIAFLPDVAISANITSNITAISPYYSALDTVLPMDTLIAILAIELVFIGFYFSYKLIRWAYVKIPFIN